MGGSYRLMADMLEQCLANLILRLYAAKGSGPLSPSFAWKNFSLQM